MSDKDIFTTEDTLEGREKLSKLFDILLTQYDEALRRDPEFAQTLSQLSNEYERRIDESLSRRALPADGGLASLVGLGDDAAEDLGHVPHLHHVIEIGNGQQTLGGDRLVDAMRTGRNSAAVAGSAPGRWRSPA